MKKVALLIAVMLLVSAFTFAEDVEFTVEGDATVTFGVNLNENPSTGFENATSSNVKFTFVTKDSKDNESDEAVYGWIKLKDFEAKVEDEEVKISNPGVEAKIMADPLWIQIDSNPDVKIDKASITQSVTSGVGVVNRNVLEPDWDSSGGVTIGIDVPDMAEIKVELVSETSWDNSADAVDPASDKGVWKDDDENDATPDVWAKEDGTAAVVRDEQNAYAVTAEAKITAVENLEVVLTGGMGVKYEASDVMAGGASVSYEIAIDDDISVKPVVGVDVVSTKVGDADADVRFEVGGGVQLKTPGTWDDKKKNDVFAEDKVFSGLSIGVIATNGATDINKEDIGLNLVVSAYEDSGDDGLVPMLGYTVVVEVLDLLGAVAKASTTIESVSSMGLGLFADLTVDLDPMTLKPYLGLKVITGTVDMVGLDAVTTTKAALWVGLEIGDIIPNTTLTLAYKSSEVLENEDQGQVMDKGVFTTAIKIKY